MTGILIIDDEATICAGLRAMIASLDLPGIGEISLAGGKGEALRLALEKKPGIVISDICLPDGNGLELIRELQSATPAARFIVLSGYDNFEYAKEAIKLGVMDYLLKPAGIEELQDVLKSALASLKKQRAQEENDSPANRLLILESGLNRAFTSGPMGDEEINRSLDDLGIVFRHPFFTVGITFFENGFFAAGEADDAESLLPKAGSAMLTAHGIEVTAFRDFSRNLVLLFNSSCPPNEDAIPRFMRMIGKSLTQAARGGFLSALSAAGQGPASVHGLYRQCRQALEYRLLYQPGDIIPYKDIAGKSAGMISGGGELSELAGYLNSYKDSMKEINCLIDRLINMETLVKYDINSIRLLYQQLMQVIGFASVEGKLLGNGGAYRDFGSFVSLNDLRIYLKETACNISGLMKTAQKERTVVDIAKRYVKDNYCKDINLAVVANIVSMNYSYFSKLFKNRTGMNFSDYVLQVRMEEAKKLLADPVNRIFEISARVGYDNPKHFARAFKGYAGVTPSEFQTGAAETAAQE